MLNNVNHYRYKDYICICEENKIAASATASEARMCHKLTIITEACEFDAGTKSKLARVIEYNVHKCKWNCQLPF